MGSFDVITFVDESASPGTGPYLNAANTNYLWDGVKRAHDELNALTPSALLTKIKSVDGAGSGLDADLLDGYTSADLLKWTDRGAANGVASLVSGLIPTSQLPALAINDVFTVASQAAMLALTVQRGDLAIRTDFEPDRSYVLAGDDPTVLANWVRVTFGDVVSVNGQTGVIVLGPTDVSAIPASEKDAISGVAALNASRLVDPVRLGTGTLNSTTALHGDGVFRAVADPSATPALSTFIEGLTLTWNSPGTNGNNLTVTSGAAWIESLARVLNVPSTLTGPTMTFAASTFYYIYLYDNAGTPALEISTTAPAAPYKGTARSKSADTSRRYLGTVKTNADGTPRMWSFSVRDGDYWYTEDIIYTASPWSISNGSTFAAGTVVRLGTTHGTAANRLVPPTSKLAYAVWQTQGSVYFQTSEDALTDSTASSGRETASSNVRGGITPLVLNSSQELIVYSAAANYATLWGYKEER